MSTGELSRTRNTFWIGMALLLAVPAWAPRTAAAANASRSFGQSEPSMSRAERNEELQEQEQERLDREQEARDREQEKRDREEEARDRAEEKREREQERLDRLSELYDDGREALDEDRYERAESSFDQLAQMNGPQTDAALYWKAYAQNRMGKKDTSLATIADLKKRFPQSRWQKDAAALEIEVRQSSGQPANPE